MLNVPKINTNVSAYKPVSAEQQKIEAASAISKSNADTKHKKEHNGVEFIKGKDTEKITEIVKECEESRMEKLSNMISQMLGKQSENFKMTTVEMSRLLSADDIAAAKAAIAEGGEYSVTAVSTRILEMAKALSGGDMTKFNLLKDAVISGFESAERIFGGKMPKITDETYNAVINGFNEWEAEAYPQILSTNKDGKKADLSE